MHDPTYSFLAGSFENMPPLFIVVGSLESKFEIMHTKQLYDKMVAALDITPYQFHCPADLGNPAPENLLAVGRIAEFIKRTYNGSR